MNSHNGHGKQNGKIATVDAPRPVGYNGNGGNGHAALSAREEALCQVIAQIVARKMAGSKGKES